MTDDGAGDADIEWLRTEPAEIARLKAAGVDVTALEADFNRRAYVVIAREIDVLAELMGHLRTTAFAAMLAAGRTN